MKKSEIYQILIDVEEKDWKRSTITLSYVEYLKRLKEAHIQGNKEI